jgi:hypothetical protein
MQDIILLKMHRTHQLHNPMIRPGIDSEMILLRQSFFLDHCDFYMHAHLSIIDTVFFPLVVCHPYCLYEYLYSRLAILIMNI